MTDLIRRQDAIDALEQLWDMSTVDGITASTVLKQIKTDIRNLPSAQPEIIRCKDCKWWGREVTYKDGTKAIDCKKGWSGDADGYCYRAEIRTDTQE